MKVKKTSIIMLLVLLLTTQYCVSPSFAQTNPTITSPAYDGMSFYRGDMTITWAAVSGASYKISLRDTTANMLVLNGISVSSTSYVIPKKYFYEGHNYRVAVSATCGSTVTWGQRTFSIKLSSARNTILSRGNTMNSFTWTPTKNVRGWKNGTTFYAGTTYSGIPYSQTEYQSSISSVSWVGGRYFDSAMKDSNSGFYDDYTSPAGYICPKYGNDCSGYVSICWNIYRENTTGISSHPRVGKTTESVLKQFARLSPGDALVDAGNHTFIIKTITPVNNSSGVVYDYKFTCNEQTPYYCRSTTRYASSYTGYIGVAKDYSLAQDYTWNWQ